MTRDEVRLARAYLLRVAEPPAMALTLFVAEHGPVEAARLIRAGTVPDSVLNEASARRHIDNPAQDLADAATVGARFLIPEDKDWPTAALLLLDKAFGRGL